MSIKLTPMALVYLLTAFLTLCVISFGAYTRLTDAGLGCPDWPGCYGQLLISSPLPESAHLGKAWTEMIHRYLAGTLGILISLCLIDSLRVSRRMRHSRLLPIGIFVLLAFQALLGMWTVTLKLEPLVVLAHLLGGMSLLGLFWWLFLNKLDIRLPFKDSQTLDLLKKLSLIGLGALTVQVTLGGLTSAHYAALVCPGFPNCYPGYSLTNEFIQNTRPKMTLHMLHRIGAVFTFMILSFLALQIYRKMPFGFFRVLSIGLIMVLCSQIALGLINVLAILPLSVAVGHNTLSALLLVLLTTLIFTLRLKPI